MVSISKILIVFPATLRLQKASAFTLQRSSLHASSFQHKTTNHHWGRTNQRSSTPKVNGCNAFNYRDYHHSSHLFTASSNGNELQKENLYMEWTIEDDQYLSEHMKDNLPKLASHLGRGLRGVESRITKLNDVNSFAYQRLYVGQASIAKEEDRESTKLTPAKEVMRRIQWDYGLDPNDFMVEYFDRVEETTMSTPFGAKNDSVKGKEEMFVFAIPEHRIMVIKYKERTVWDKVKKIDRVFGSMNGKGETIDQVQANYDEWEQRQAEIDEYNKQRQKEMTFQIKAIMGEHLFAALKVTSTTLQNQTKIDMIEPQAIDDYVQDALQLFRKARAVSMEDLPNMPQNDAEALDLFSNLVALLPDDELRERILDQIFKQVTSLDPSRRSGGSQSSNDNQRLPDMNEDDLIETFVRGSGAGGQKINKTASKVLLIHGPTQIRVECQDTRSLQQNRKIARKRLKLKLDEYWNGSQSKNQKKISIKVSKKQKQKTRNKARLRKKKESEDDSDEIGGIE